MPLTRSTRSATAPTRPSATSETTRLRRRAAIPPTGSRRSSACGTKYSARRYRVSRPGPLRMDDDRLGNLRSGMSKGFDFPNSRGSPRQTGDNDFGDHRATRALCALRRLPARAAVSSPRPRSRNPASLHAGVLAFGVPPRTERPPQAGRGMGMPRPALRSALRGRRRRRSEAPIRRLGCALRGCSATATRPGLRK